MLSQVVSPNKDKKGFKWELYWAFTAGHTVSPDQHQDIAKSGEVKLDLPPGAQPMPRRQAPPRPPPGVAPEFLQILPLAPEQKQLQKQQREQLKAWTWRTRNMALLGFLYQQRHGISNEERESPKFQMMCWRGDSFHEDVPLQRFAVPETDTYKVIEAPEPLRRELSLFFCMARFLGLEVSESCLKELRSDFMSHISSQGPGRQPHQAASVAGVKSRREHSRREPNAIVGDPCWLATAELAYPEGHNSKPLRVR